MSNVILDCQSILAKYLTIERDYRQYLNLVDELVKLCDDKAEFYSLNNHYFVFFSKTPYRYILISKDWDVNRIFSCVKTNLSINK